MAALEAEVRAIQKDGLLWGTSKLAPVGFGIKKLQITCVIEDAKVRRHPGRRPNAVALLSMPLAH
jgi:translation elongation factor EF-1beta